MGKQKRNYWEFLVFDGEELRRVFIGGDDI